MQIIINLTADQDIKPLLKGVLTKLERDGYRINTLYGRLIFDNKEKKVVDIGEPGDIYPVSDGFVDALMKTNAKTAVIFVEEKYIVFTNTYAVAAWFSSTKYGKPINLDVFNDYYKSLVVDKDKRILDGLYRNLFRKTFEEYKEALIMATQYSPFHAGVSRGLQEGNPTAIKWAKECFEKGMSLEEACTDWF